MRQLRVCLDAPDLVGDNLPDLALDAVVVGVDLLLHGVVAVLVGEVDDLRNLHVAGGLPLDLLVIHYNLGMENLLLDALVEIVVYLANLEYPFFGNLNFPTLLVCSIYIH